MHPATRFPVLFAGFLALFCESVLVGQPADPPKESTRKRERISSRPQPVPRRLADQLALSVDAGDSYRTAQGRRTLRRLAGAVAIELPGAQRSFLRDLTGTGRPLEGFNETRRAGAGFSVWMATPDARLVERQFPQRGTDRLRQARAVRGGETINPVFIDPRTGLQILITKEVVVRLKPGVEPKGYFGAAWKNVRSNWDASAEFILTLPQATAEEVFAEVDRLANDPAVEWAEPDFVGQIIRSFTPNDPYFPRQWHLENSGQGGGNTGADAKLTAAWDIVTGKSNVVIAVMDDGVELDHPDLSANIFRNPGEIADNGVDDDGNGVIDDFQGYNFVYNLPDPAPYSVDDNHGTAVAGIVAASGNNSVGSVGAAYGCRILPIKVLEGEESATTTSFARALRYVGGLNGSGSSVWRGADVVNISLTFYQSLVTDAALQDLVTKGRNGRGCAVFVAAGNSAGAWEPVTYDVPANGTYTLRWEYSKDSLDPSDSRYIGDDTAWLDSITYPDGSKETFEASTLPPGWSTSAFSPWTVVKDGESGNRALTGWNGFGSRSVRAGHLNHNQTNYLQCTRQLTPGPLVFWVWVSSELRYDYFDFYVNGTLEFSQSGVPITEQVVDYPANNPNTIAVGASTDFDYRADYSQFGTQLDLLSPSDGGSSAVATTDRTAGFGYNDGSDFDDGYTLDFGGTSASTPLATGVAALALSLNPYLTSGDIRTLLRATADKVGGVGYDSMGRNLYYGSGRLNASRAVAQARPNLLVSVTAPNTPVSEGDQVTYTVLVRNTGLGRSGPITVTNLLPENAFFVSAIPAPTSRSGRRLTFSNTSLASGDSWSISISLSNSVAGTNVLVTGASTDVSESLSGDNVATISTPVLAIPRFLLTNATVVEGNSGRTNASLAVRLSNPSSRTVTVNFATVTNTASSSDFAAVRGRLTFLPGETNRSLVVGVNGDTRNEGDESLAVIFSAPLNAVLEESIATVTILNDDALPLVTAPDLLRKEGNSGAAKAIFKLRLSAPSGRVVSIDFQTAPGTAVSGVDFQPTNGTVVFAPGKVTANVAVLVAGDKLLEENETFTLNLANAENAILDRDALRCTIVNNDPMPKLYADDTMLAESTDGMTNAALAVRLSAAAGIPVTFAYTTTNGSALAGTDYVETNSWATFAPGDTNLIIEIPVMGDSLVESNEFFSVRLSAATNALIARGLAKVTLVNDDAASLAGNADRSIVAATHFRATGVLVDGVFQLQFQSQTGLRYTLEWRPHLDFTEPWRAVPGIAEVEGNGTVQTISDPAALAHPQGFYRIRRSP